MRLKCWKFESQIPLVVDGDLDESARDRVLEHVEHCPSCRRDLRLQAVTHEAIIQDPHQTPAPVYFEGVLEEIHRKMPIRATVDRYGLIDWIRNRSAAASTAMACLFFLWVGAGIAVLDLDGDTGLRASSLETQQARDATPTPRSVRTGNIGLVCEGTPVFDYLEQMTPEQLMHLGIDASPPERKPARLLAWRRQAPSAPVSVRREYPPHA